MIFGEDGLFLLCIVVWRQRCVLHYDLRGNFIFRRRSTTLCHSYIELPSFETGCTVVVFLGFEYLLFECSELDFPSYSCILVS